MAWELMMKSVSGETDEASSIIDDERKKAPESISLRDTLVVVRDTTSYIALMPIRWRDRAYWAVGQEVAFEVDGRDGSLRGRIAEIGRQIQMVNGEQFLPVKAQIESAGAALVPGALVQCVVGTAAVGPWEFIRHAFAP